MTQCKNINLLYGLFSLKKKEIFKDHDTMQICYMVYFFVIFFCDFFFFFFGGRGNNYYYNKEQTNIQTENICGVLLLTNLS